MTTKAPKLLSGVKPGDPIWSGGERWIVSAVLKTVVYAERPGSWLGIRGSWRMDGQPSRAEAPAEIETPELFARWRAKQDAEAERTRKMAEYRESESIVRRSIDCLRLGGLPLSKARALERFVDQLTREGE